MICNNALLILFSMVYTESLLSKLNNGDLTCIALDMQNSKLDINSIRTDINKELSELRKSYNKIETDLAVFKSVTKIMRNRKFILEQKSWIVTG